MPDADQVGLDLRVGFVQLLRPPPEGTGVFGVGLGGGGLLILRPPVPLAL